MVASQAGKTKRRRREKESQKRTPYVLTYGAGVDWSLPHLFGNYLPKGLGG